MGKIFSRWSLRVTGRWSLPRLSSQTHQSELGRRVGETMERSREEGTSLGLSGTRVGTPELRTHRGESESTL